MRFIYLICVMLCTLGLAKGASLHDERLWDIVQQQVRVMERFAMAGDQSDKEQAFQRVAQAYSAFLKDNPNSVQGHILYGKFLRQCGQEDAAYAQFIEANTLDPNIAVVKQHLGNFLAERGQYALALPHFMSAVALSPNEAIYHYQLGELLCTYKDLYIQQGLLTQNTLEQQLLAAFKEASQLDPTNSIFAFRYAEAFFDVQMPDWNQALGVWQGLQSAAQGENQEYILLNLARIWIHLGQKDKAKKALSNIFNPRFEKGRQALLNQL